MVIATIIPHDPPDDQVLPAALGGTADIIVSGDAHLLDLGQYQGIQIMDAIATLNLLQ